MATAPALLEERRRTGISEVANVSVLRPVFGFTRRFEFAAVCGAEAQRNRERVIQSVDSAVQAGEGRHLAPGLHQLPVRPITQNGRHASAAVATETSLASGKPTVRYCGK